MNRNRARKQLTNLPTKLSDWTATFDGSIETDLFGGTFSERIAIGRLRPGREECFRIERQFKLFVRIIRFEFLVRLLRFWFVVRHVRFVGIRIIRIVILIGFWLDLWLCLHNRNFRLNRFRIVFGFLIRIIVQLVRIRLNIRVVGILELRIIRLLRVLIQFVKCSGKQRAVCEG